MTITWSGARDKVRGDLWRPGTSGVPDDVCDRSLHAALLDLESRRRWLWLENIFHTVTLPMATAIVDLPVDLRSVTSFALTEPGGRIWPSLGVYPIGRIRELSSIGRQGNPLLFALSNGDAYLDCAAPAGSSFDLVYTARTPQLLETAVAAASNLTLSLQQAIVIAGAAARVALTYLKNEAEAARQQVVFDRGVDRLMDEEDDARSGGSIIPDTDLAVMAWGC